MFVWSLLILVSLLLSLHNLNTLTSLHNLLTHTFELARPHQRILTTLHPHHNPFPRQLIHFHHFLFQVILPLYQQFGKAAVDMLDGMYSFALHDLSDDSYLIARDHMGITSLYHGWTAEGAHAVASELKALTDICESIEVGGYKKV